MKEYKAVAHIYKFLLKEYGPQGWWPLLDYKDKGYHPGDYSYPVNESQVFEICVGAILTQNTAWTNVEKVLVELSKKRILDPGKLLKTNISIIKKCIYSAGYYNQKARKLIEFSKFYIALKGRAPNRVELLSIWGIGPETADSILLYGFKVPTFVVDNYTKRILISCGYCSDDANYNEIKCFFENNLKKDFKVFQEYHALLVEHAKNYYTSKKNIALCPLAKSIVKTTNKESKK